VRARGFFVLAAAGALVLAVAALTFAMLLACGEPAARSAAAALHLVVFPVAALRPLAHGPRSLYRRFDALTVAAALLPPDRFGALAARELLAADGVSARVVSMPSFELFREQSAAYRDEVLPPGMPARVAVEAASPFGWHEWVGDHGRIVALDRFGASAPGPEVLEALGITRKAVAAAARHQPQQDPFQDGILDRAVLGAEAGRTGRLDRLRPHLHL